MRPSEPSNRRELNMQGFIDMLDENPSDEELLQAAKRLRQQKVEQALDKTVAAVRFDRKQVTEEFVAERQNFDTRRKYLERLKDFFSWADREGIHILQIRRADLIRYRDYLKSKRSINGVRNLFTAVTTFYGYLEAERFIDRNPSVQIPLPRREYKKSIKPDPDKTIPIMRADEFDRILDALNRQKTERGKHISVERRRESAARLLPAIQFMGLFGLRVGDLQSVRVNNGGFSYRAKGGNVKHRQKHESWDMNAAVGLLRGLNAEPFKNLKTGTVQIRLKDLTKKLTEEEQLRYPFTCHDLRHLFARKMYQAHSDVYEVSRFLGHESISTTVTYLQQIGLLT